MTFRIGIIGAGTHGARYLRHAHDDMPGMKPVAICRRDHATGEALAAQWDCRYHRGAEELILSPEVDGVIVCTPPSSHFPLARAVLQAGKPLLLEKPMTGTLAEADELCRLDATDLAPPLMVAQSLRWNPVIRKVKQMWLRLGRVHHVRLAQRLAPTQLLWQRDPEQSVGGSVLLTGVHIFDLARYLTGREFVEIDSRQRQVLHPALEDFFLSRATLDNGAWVSLEVSKYTQSRACWLEAVGEDAQLLADYMFGEIRLLQGRQCQTIAVDATTPTLPALLADWLAAVGGEAPVAVDAEDGRRTLEVVTASYRSDSEERPLSLAEVRS